MNQIDVLNHAHEWLVILSASQLDPVGRGMNGDPLPADSAGREEKVRKLFDYVSQHLVRIIMADNAPNRKPFALSAQQRAQLVPSEGNLGMMDLTKRINRVVDLRVMWGISKKALQAWLIQEGYVDPQHHQMATQKGLDIGLVNGTYEGHPWFWFSPAAQQVIFQQLDTTGLDEPTSKYARQYVRKSIQYPDLLRQNLQSMERLSQGLHPFTGAPLAAQDPLCQERLRQCFAFVATALERSLAAGHYTAKGPFQLPQELWDQIPIRQEPVPLGRFVSDINALRPDPTAVTPLLIGDVSSYLAEQGLMENALSPTGKTTRRLNAQGEALGILPEVPMTTQDGESYTGVGYTAQAQRYLVEHMGELIEYCAR